MENTQSKMLPTSRCCYYNPDTCDVKKDEHLCRGVECGYDPCVLKDDPHCCEHGFIFWCESIAVDKVERADLVQNMKREMIDASILKVIRKYWNLPTVDGWTHMVEDACAELKDIKGVIPPKYLGLVEEIMKMLVNTGEAEEKDLPYHYEVYDECFDNMGVRIDCMNVGTSIDFS